MVWLIKKVVGGQKMSTICGFKKWDGVKTGQKQAF